MARHRDPDPDLDRDMPNQDPGPRLVIDPVPGSTQFRWRLEHDGQTLAMGVEIYPDKISAVDGSAKTSLMILHQLSSSYSRLCRQIRDAPKVGETSGEEGKAADEATCCDGGGEESATSDDAEIDAEIDAELEEKGRQIRGMFGIELPGDGDESEEELSERARLDAEAEAPDDGEAEAEWLEGEFDAEVDAELAAEDEALASRLQAEEMTS